jgi:hypothetical protein
MRVRSERTAATEPVERTLMATLWKRLSLWAIVVRFVCWW